MSFRIGNDVPLRWVITRGGQPVDLRRVRSKSLYAVAPAIRQALEFSVGGDDGNVVTTMFCGKDQKFCGNYHLLLVCNEGLDNMFSVDSLPAFTLVPVTASDEPVITVELASDIFLPQNGLSAYEIAKLHGYPGTEEEWLAEYQAPQSAIAAAAEALASAQEAKQSARDAVDAEAGAIAAAAVSEEQANRSEASAGTATTAASNVAQGVEIATAKAAEAVQAKQDIDQTLADLSEQGESAVVAAQGQVISGLQKDVDRLNEEVWTPVGEKEYDMPKGYNPITVWNDGSKMYAKAFYPVSSDVTLLFHTTFGTSVNPVIQRGKDSVSWDVTQYTTPYDAMMEVMTKEDADYMYRLLDVDGSLVIARDYNVKVRGIFAFRYTTEKSLGVTYITVTPPAAAPRDLSVVISQNGSELGRASFAERATAGRRVSVSATTGNVRCTVVPMRDDDYDYRETIITL